MNKTRWTRFVASRWFSRGRNSGPSLAPATAGIAVGVSALLCIIGVMNGFQLGFIDAVLDLDSYHLRVSSSGTSPAAILAALPDAVTALPFVDIRTMVANARGKAAPLRIKIVPNDAIIVDPSFSDRLIMRSGTFEGGLVIGSELARSLDLRVGDSVSTLSVRADEETGIDATMADLRIAGVYHSGYYEYDAGLAFLSESSAGNLGAGETPIIGVKLRDRYGDAAAIEALSGAGIDGAESWRTYNRAFFGALRMEKSVMMMLVGLIFIVVGVNIFHSMRKAVYGRVEEIATIRALGADGASVRRIFMIDGIAAGSGGALLGLIIGLLVSMNVNGVFSGIEAILAGIGLLFGGASSGFTFFSPDLFYIGDVPVRLLFPETLFITTAGAASAVIAAWAASSRVSRIMPSEVLRNE